MTSDLGSQLESAAGKLLLWWTEMKDSRLEVVGKINFLWDIGPANLLWREGKCEQRIGVIKRPIEIAVGDSKLSPLNYKLSSLSQQIFVTRSLWE